MGAVMSYSVALGPGGPCPAALLAVQRLHPDRRGLGARARRARGARGADPPRPQRPGDLGRVRSAGASSCSKPAGSASATSRATPGTGCRRRSCRRPRRWSTPRSRRRPSRLCEHTFVRWENLRRSEHAGPAPRAWGVDGSHLRRARGARHPLSRDRGAVGDQRGAEAIADAVPLDDQPVPGMHSCLRLLLRPPHAHLSRPERARGLRARDRRQGQRAGAGSRRARQAVLEGRARRARDEHRSVPVGRGPLQADAADLGGDARLRQPVLDPHQVAAAAARHRADEGALRADRVRRQPLDPDARGEGVAVDRAAHAASRASGSRRSPSSLAPGSRSGC